MLRTSARYCCGAIFFFNDTATTEIYTLSLHDALPICLRFDLDFMPSPAEEHPGLLIRDGHHFSDAVLIVPPLLVESLACFDGKKTDLDLRAVLVRLTGDLDVGEIARSLVEALSGAGFLEDRSEERRVGKECRSRWSPYHYKK